MGDLSLCEPWSLTGKWLWLPLWLPLSWWTCLYFLQLSLAGLKRWLRRQRHFPTSLKIWVWSLGPTEWTERPAPASCPLTSTCVQGPHPHVRSQTVRKWKCNRNLSFGCVRVLYFPKIKTKCHTLSGIWKSKESRIHDENIAWWQEHLPGMCEDLGSVPNADILEGDERKRQQNYHLCSLRY